MENRTKIGVGIMVFRDGKILLGKRKNSHGGGEYAFPGGGLKYMESFEGTARREIQEEAGIEVENIRFLLLANSKTYKPLHFIHIGLAADWISGEAEAKEPEKCEGWHWYELDKLPTPLFDSVQTILDAYKGGRNYIDA